MPLAAGDVFAGYTILRPLGTGGMGAVYLVRHPRLPRHDALKLLNRELSNEPDFVARFLREADIVSSLSHRNIVSIYDRGEEDGQLWLTMRYVDGIDGEAALAEAGGLFPAARAVHIIGEVASALDAAHRRQLIHRDVKPANILLCASDDDESEQVFLTDFGIAKSLEASSRLTRTGLVVATFDYASPEQIEAEPLDSRSDVYSLGCVLYKFLTGSVPFPGEMMLAAAAGHLGQPPPRPTQLAPWLPPALDDVVIRAMAKEPAERFPTCRALAAAAAAALDQFPDAPRPPYRMFLSRTVNAGGSGQHLGPMRTDALSQQETERLVGLVRRTRFFDLPENLAGSAPPERQVTIEIACTGRAHRVIADLDNARRPPELGELVAAIERMSTPMEPPPVRVSVLPTPPPARPGPLPPPPREAAPVGQGAVSAPSVSRFAQPPPPLPPASAPLHPFEHRTAPAGPPAGAPGSPPGSPPVPARQPEPLPGHGGYQPNPGPGGYPHAPGGPGLPPPPLWQQPGGGLPPKRRRTGRTMAIIAAVVAVLVAAGVTTFLLTRTSPPAGDGGTPSQPTIPPYTASPDAKAALDALPASTTPLPETTMVVPRRVDGNIDLYLLDTTTDQVGKRLTTGPEDDQGPVLSPDRKTIVYVHEPQDGPAELRAIAVGGTGDVALFPDGIPHCKQPGRPAWDPDEPTLLVVACGDDPSAARLLLLSMDGETVRDLHATNRPVIQDISFSPDGTRIAYWAGGVRSAQGGIFVQYLDGESEATQVTNKGLDKDVAWSPDGALLAFSRGVEGGREIFVQRPDPGAEEKQLTHDGGVNEGPAWSPDGSMIVYSSDRQTDAASGDHWWLMTAEGGDQHAIDTDGKSYDTPAWGPAPAS